MVEDIIDRGERKTFRVAGCEGVRVDGIFGDLVIGVDAGWDDVCWADVEGRFVCFGGGSPPARGGEVRGTCCTGFLVDCGVDRGGVFFPLFDVVVCTVCPSFWIVVCRLVAIMLSIVIPPGRIFGRPPCSCNVWIASKVKLFGLLELPKTRPRMLARMRTRRKTASARLMHWRLTSESQD